MPAYSGTSACTLRPNTVPPRLLVSETLSCKLGYLYIHVHTGAGILHPTYAVTYVPSILKKTNT